MNNDVGFYCPVVHNTEQYNRIKAVLNGLSEQYNTIMFNSQYNVIDQAAKRYAVLHCNQARYFYGLLFAFDIDSVSVITNFPGPKNKIFVASDIFWQNKMMPSNTWISLLPQDLHIITHNQKIADLYSICFKAPIMNMTDNPSTEEFSDVIKKLLETQ